MRILFGLRGIKKFKNPVVTLGIFDGVHRGHRRILQDTVACARGIKGKSIAVTFWPHPHKENTIYSLEHRLRLIGQIGIDVCIVIRFNKSFSRISAVDFIKDILVKRIGARYIYVGKNFRFGKYARGDVKLLNRLSRIYNFRLKVFDVLKRDNRPISSTFIRALIMEGDLKTAKELLSRPVSVLGTVIKGTALGKRLGFPTANINPHHEVLPPCGVWAVEIIFNEQKLNGICYIGTKPTFKIQDSKYIEVYIFNFNQDIYGQYLEIRFIKKIREEQRFTSRHSLVKQIKKDIRLTRRIFSRH